MAVRLWKLPFWICTVLLFVFSSLGFSSDLNQPWSSSGNQRYYSQVPINFYERLAAERGLTRCRDLLTLFAQPTLQPLSSHRRILEVGGGDGRVVKWLVENLPASNIAVVDFSDSAIAHMRERFRANPNVRITQANILEYLRYLEYSGEKQDLILWMWSGFMELNSSERESALWGLRNNLSFRGRIVIDLPRAVMPEAGLEMDERSIRITDEFGEFRAERIEEAELVRYLAGAGLKLIKKIDYTTDANQPRTMYVIAHRKLYYFLDRLERGMPRISRLRHR